MAKTTGDRSPPRHRYPTRRKLRLDASGFVDPKVFRVEDRAKDRVLVPCKRRKDERFTFHLPREIIFNILLLIPAKALHEVVRHVCKQWFYIVSDPMFVRVHRQMSSTGFLIQNPEERSMIYYIQADTARLMVTEFQIPFPARIIGSFNGLVLLHYLTKQDIFHVVNPVTKVKFRLPPLTGLGNIIDSKAGFGLDSSGLYKVFHVSVSAKACSDIQLEMRVLTLGIDIAWRFIDLHGISLNTDEKIALTRSPCFIAGFIYWYNMTLNNSVAVDVDTETIYQFSLPVGLSRRDGTPLRLLSTETFLGLIRPKGDIWRFWKLTSVKTGEWTEVAGINIQPVLSRVDKMFPSSKKNNVWPVRLINGDFWFYRCVNEDEYVVVRYNLVSNNLSFFPMAQVYSDTLIYPHAHTLLSPTNCKPGIV